MVSILPKRAASDDGESAEGRVLRERLDAYERRANDERIAALRRRVDATPRVRTTGGPCVYCGVSEQLGPWYGNPGRLSCAACADDRWDHADLDHKTIIINRIATGDWKTRLHTYGENAQRLVDRTGFRWFCETPGAQPGGWHRWAYLDLQAVAERAAPTTERPPPRFSAGDPCDRCGCAYLWTNLPSVTAPGETFRPAGFGCAGCVTYAGLSDVVRHVVGIVPVLEEWVPNPVNPDRGTSQAVDVPARLGVTWYRDRPVRTSEKRRQVTLAPFAYLDLPTIRARAFDLFPFESQWTAKAAWQALKDERGRTWP